MFLFIASAYAQEAAATPAANQPAPWASFLPFVIIFLVFYFLMIRPQKKKLDQEKQFLSALKKGDEVYTKSGVIGTIAGMTEKIVTLEVSDNTKIKFLRSQVAGLAKNIFAPQEQAKK
jgi:preprotein translocase subunit YajC